MPDTSAAPHARVSGVDITDVHINGVERPGDELQIDWSDGLSSHLYALWLRDHCQMPESRDPDSGQRFLNVTDIPEDCAIASAQVTADGGLDVVFQPEGHRSLFTADWLRAHCYCLNGPYDDRSEAAKRLWAGPGDFPDGLPVVPYADFAADPKARLKALRALRSVGFALLTGVPAEDGMVLRVIDRVGYLRETNYGRLFDVRAVEKPTNLAYTNLGLGAHTDNPYRDPVPGVQMLHCLVNQAGGGESVLVDGFKAAAILRADHPEAFDRLARTPVNFRYADDRADLVSRATMIEVGPRGRVRTVRFNNRSIAPLRLAPAEVRPFYAAYRAFAAILERPDLKLTRRLDPGDLVMFDNTRVLHARTAITQGGARHLQGAYSDLDGLFSTLAVLERRTAP
ncbi:MAG: TauD/TfdA family dioxygenase [Rhodobacterales bacterium]|nr:TauD/TfdA family dioxygenase [Rhodobacterales bacterium]